MHAGGGLLSNSLFYLNLGHTLITNVALRGWLTLGTPVLDFDNVACATWLSIHVFATSILSLTEDFKVCLEKLHYFPLVFVPSLVQWTVILKTAWLLPYKEIISHLTVEVS